MEQRAPQFIRQCITGPINKQSMKALILDVHQAASLQSALSEDAKGAIYSAMVSMADAYAGIHRGLFSWATVKLYYSCFYWARARLARAGAFVFYVDKSPFYLVASPGQSPQLKSGNSHTVVTGVYKASIATLAMNRQPIDGISAFDWMARRREDVNYKLAKFDDPVVPDWFKVIDGDGAVRRLIGSYLDDLDLYAYNPDHAMIALPLAAMVDELRSKDCFDGLGLDEVGKANLRGMLVDKKGPIHHFKQVVQA